MGELGEIIRTTDGGTNSFKQLSGITERLLDVSFIDSSNGVAVGYQGTILRTTNAGVTWVNQ